MANALSRSRWFRTATAVAMTISLGSLFLLTGCGGDEAPKTAETTGLVPEDEPATPPAAQPSTEALPAAPNGQTAAPAQPPVLNPTQPATPAPTDASGQPAPPVQPIAPAQPPAIEEMTAEQLVGRLGEIQSLIQRVEQQGIQIPMDRFKVILEEMRNTGDRLMKMTDTTTDNRRLGAVSKSMALSYLSEINQTDPTEELKQMGQELAGDSNPEMAKLGKWMLFQLEATQHLTSDPPNAAAVVAMVNEVIASETDREETMLGTMQMLIQVLMQSGHEAEATAVTKATGEAFKDNANPELARIGKWMAFQADALGHLTSDPPDPAAVVALVQETLTAEQQRDAMMLSALQGVIQSLREQGHQDAAVQLLEECGNAFKDNPNPELAKEGAAMIDRIPIIKLIGLHEAVMSGRADAEKSLVEALAEFIAEPKPRHEELQMALAIAGDVESAGKIDTAREIYRMIDDAARAKNDPQLNAQIDPALDWAHKRLSLIGQSIEIPGQQVDGAPFDWNQYRGKIVLVDFWATWCGPCLGEIPNMKALYERYHDQGFDIVGVNMDNQIGTVSRFLTNNPLPWVTVVSSDPNKFGSANPILEKYGVESIPFMVLVDREGKVIGIHMRGARLEEKLAELFGNAGTAPPTAPAPPTTPAPPTAPPMTPPGTPGSAAPAPPGAPLPPPAVPAPNAAPPGAQTPPPTAPAPVPPPAVPR